MRYALLIALIFKAAIGLTQKSPEIIQNSARNRIIDSLELALKNASQEERFEINYSLFREYLPVDQNVSWEHINEALEQAKIEGDSLGIVRAVNGIGGITKNRGEIKEAIELFDYALGVSQRNDYRNQVKFLLNNLAMAFGSIGVYDRSLYYNFESLKLRELEGDAKDISVALNNIGVTYERLHDYSNALIFYQKSYDTKVRNGIQFDVDQVLINIALTYNYLKEFKEAESLLLKAKQSCIESNCTPDKMIEINNAFGEILFNQSMYQQAQKCFEESLRLTSDNVNSIYMSGTLFTENYSLILYWLGYIHYYQSNFEKAIEYLNESLKTSEQAGIQETTMKNYKLISKILASRNDYKQAYEFQDKYIQLNSELLNGKVISRITTLRTNFDQKENLSKIAAQNKILSLQKELNISIGAIAILTIIISIVLFRINIQKQKVNVILDRKVHERTRELETHRNELLHAHDEKVMVLRRVSSNLSSSLATLKGMSRIAMYDLPQHHHIYFKEVETTTEQMVAYVKHFTSDIA